MTSEIPEQYYTEAGRLATFQTKKRRTSNASSKASKSQKWPLSFLSPEKLAEAGFFFNPTSDNPDNVTCFLCEESICGWEKGDDPLDEHLKLSPSCGWAIVASIEKKETHLSREHPLNARMLEARQATFGDKWPHEGKKGWKCKVKQLAEAGWIYKPTPEYDDFAKCVYCGLALDGWEPGDKPLDEHHNRAPNCDFFNLIATLSPATKKPSKARKPRASKATRLSTQSNLTALTEAPSFLDITAREDESILTTATTASPSGRKMAKGKKAAGKGRKTKPKLEEVVPEPPPFEPEDDDFEVKIEQKPTAKRGTKRTSAAVQEASLMEVAEPAPKRRVTRARGSMAVQSIIAPAPGVDVSMVSVGHDVSEKPAPRKRIRASTVRGTRKVSSASRAPSRPIQPNDPQDEHQNDVSQMQIDDHPEAPTTRRQSRAPKANLRASTAPTRKTRASKVTKADYSMFSAEGMDIDDAQIEAELKTMEQEESQPLPKAKAAKGKQTRKPSTKKQAATQQADESKMDIDTSNVVPEPEIMKPVKGRRVAGRAPSRNLSAQPAPVSFLMDESELPEPDFDNTQLNEDDAMDVTANASQETVVRGGKKSKTGAKKPAAKKQDADEKEEVVAPKEDKELHIEAPVKKAGKSKKTSHADETENLKAQTEPVEESAAVKPSKAKSAKSKAKGKASTAIVEPEPESLEQTEEASKIDIPTEPAQTVPLSPMPSKSTKDLTPSPSPQSSDAENHPPSSKPSTATKPLSATPTTSRTPLAPIAHTPAGNLSPSKRNILAALQTAVPWTDVDLDDVFTSDKDKENAAKLTRGVFDDAFRKAEVGDLTSPEKKMSVEEWILYNARVAEDGFRAECERIVTRFEGEGGRAMRALEGLVVRE